jgi:hypothetical protein
MKKAKISVVSSVAVVAILALALPADAQEMMSMPAEPYQQMTPAEAAGLEAPELPTPNGEMVTVRTVADQRIAEFDIGPLELMAGMEHLRIPIQMAHFPVDGWIQGFEVRMVDSEGNELPMDLLHHVNFIDPDKRELFSTISRRVMAAGRETLSEQLPSMIGYPVAEGDRMLIAAMFANALGVDYPDAHLIVSFSYRGESDGFLQPRDVYPFYLDVMGPMGDKDFPLEPGNTVQYWEGTPAVTGRILAIGGHLHDHAVKLTLTDVTSGKTIWEAEPDKNEEGRVTGVPSGSFLWTLGKKIFSDHTYRISVEYEVGEGEVAPDGGMGTIGGVVWVDKDTEWPEFDRGDDMYVADLINTLAAPDNLGGHGGHSMDDMPAEAEPGGHEH